VPNFTQIRFETSELWSFFSKWSPEKEQKEEDE